MKLVEEEFVDSMKNKESKEFRDLAAKITSAVSLASEVSQGAYLVSF